MLIENQVIVLEYIRIAKELCVIGVIICDIIAINKFNKLYEDLKEKYDKYN